MNDEVKAFKELLAANRERQGDSVPSLEEMRAGYEAIGGAFPAGEDWQCEALDIDGLPAELSHTDNHSGSQVVLYLHGGGYVIGSLITHRVLVANIARASRCKVLAIDYRLAPEHPFPAAVDDAVKAYRWLLEQGHAADNIFIAGDSAGGGLTIATLLKLKELMLKEEGLSLPAAGICLSPWVDLEAVGDSMDTKAAEDPMVERTGLLEMASHYLDGTDPRNPLAAPMYGNLADLPPLLIQVGTAETLLDDARRLATHAIEHGVNVEYQEWPDMIHVFQHFAPMISDGYRAIDQIAGFIHRQTA